MSAELQGMYEMGAGRSAMAATLGVTTATITNRLKVVKRLVDPIEALLKVQPTEISMMKIAVMENITTEKLQAANLDCLGRMMGMLDKMERLDRGKATSNTNLLIQHLDKLDRIKNGVDSRLLKGEGVAEVQSVETETTDDVDANIDDFFEDDDIELFSEAE